MVLWAFPRLQVRDVLSWNYASVVAVIRDTVARVDAEYIQSFADMGAVAEANGEELAPTAEDVVAGTMLCPDLEMDSSLGFGYDQIDLGTGPPSAFFLPDLPVEGLMVLLPSCTTKGCVVLQITVAFKESCYSL